MKKLYLIMIAMFMLAACGGGATSGSIVGGWELVSYGDTSNQTTVASIDFNTFIDFGEDGELTGNVGCNSFGGDYKVEGNQITFGSLISTLIACEEPIATQEAAVMKTFTDSATYDLNGDTLTITSADGTTSIVLKRN
jgi:heat shock protein HslJ